VRLYGGNIPIMSRDAWTHAFNIKGAIAQKDLKK
jgi:hypothetical protein